MRIDRLTLKNFKKYEEQSFDFHPRFTLLVGENGAGKTTVLDALAVAAGIWLVEVPDTSLINSRRSILPSEIRLQAETRGDRIQFVERLPVEITAFGQIGESDGIQWTRRMRQSAKKTSNAEAKEAQTVIKKIYADDKNVLCPVLAYYGAGRAWLPSNEKKKRKSISNGPARRWDAFYDCFNERIQFDELSDWFQRETTARGNRGGQWRPGFEAVKHAVLNCVSGADDFWFDADREQIVLSIDGNSQPLDNLSAGQRMMLTLTADIAIKAVTQNAFLSEEGQFSKSDESLPRVLKETPGLVLIDELDVHLHPAWQRRAAADLKRTFPSIQFVCTSHSPQVIGEIAPEEIRILDEDMVRFPPYSFGIDSSRILEELMGARSRNAETDDALRDLAKTIDEEDFESARGKIANIAKILRSDDDPEITRARTMMAFLEDTK